MIVAESFLYKVITSSFDKLFHFETKKAISSILSSKPNALHTSSCLSNNSLSSLFNVFNFSIPFFQS
jgi:hypothetical protein